MNDDFDTNQDGKDIKVLQEELDRIIEKVYSQGTSAENKPAEKEAVLPNTPPITKEGDLIEDQGQVNTMDGVPKSALTPSKGKKNPALLIAVVVFLLALAGLGYYFVRGLSEGRVSLNATPTPSAVPTISPTTDPEYFPLPSEESVEQEVATDEAMMEDLSPSPSSTPSSSTLPSSNPFIGN